MEETQSYLLTKHFAACVPVPLLYFLHCRSFFTLLAANISHFLNAAVKFSCCSSSKIRTLCFLSLALALSLLSMLVQTSKFSRKKDSACCFFSLKIRVAVRVVNVTFDIGLHVGGEQTDGHVITKICLISSFPYLFFSPMVPRCVGFARERVPL